MLIEASSNKSFVPRLKLNCLISITAAQFDRESACILYDIKQLVNWNLNDAGLRMSKSERISLYDVINIELKRFYERSILYGQRQHC